MDGVSAMGKDWYDKYKKKEESVFFNQWWESSYGKPEDYLDNIEEGITGEEDEYWRRKGNALDGWNAGLDLAVNNCNCKGRANMKWSGGL